jgi:hypothetical protein
VAGAVIGARRTGAGLALISGEALTLSRVAVTDATVGALRILVVVSESIGLVNPSELERADTLRAISTQVTHANAPVIEA